jgi:hypothetical protein
MKLGYNPKSLSEVDWIFYKKCAGWQLRFALLPRTCNISGRRIWLEHAYRGTAFYRVEDSLIAQEHKWHDKHEHIIWELKR